VCEVVAVAPLGSETTQQYQKYGAAPLPRREALRAVRTMSPSCSAKRLHPPPAAAVAATIAAAVTA